MTSSNYASKLEWPEFLWLQGFASRRTEEYGATLYMVSANGMPSGMKSFGASRFVSTCNIITMYSTGTEIKKYRLQWILIKKIF